MPGHNPFSTFPFAVNALVVASQVWLMTTGDLFTFNGRVVVGFGVCGLIVLILP